MDDPNPLPPPMAGNPPLTGSYAPPVLPAGAAAGLSLPNGTSLVSPWARLGAYFLESILFVVTLGIGWLIWAAIIAGGGQTPAKKLLNQRVVRTDTLHPVGFARMFWVRGILAGFVASLAITFTFGILLFMPFWDKRNQNLWDKISSTYVVSDPGNAWRLNS